MGEARLVAGRRVAGGAGLAAPLRRRAPTVELDWDTRQKSRFDVVDSSGRAIGIFLPRGQAVRGGDVLICEDGSLVVVRAQAQAVLRVTASDGAAADALLRAAYHLGNRHVPLEVQSACLQIEPDHVLAEMLRRMALDVIEMRAPFEPESGAYDDRSRRPPRGSDRRDHERHDHGHDHGDVHRHGHPHGPG